ncbi:MAG: NAD(P)H-quinone oxidoreductase [Alphaproteobacteria bacterium]|nr:NAD(P)H-quinone oxidoreductase [Alphaproteobacteria bacterium]
MRAIAIRCAGGPEVLAVEERPAPVPGIGEVLIRVGAAGVNRPDLLQRQGKYPPPKGASDIPGLEVAGTVVGTGPGAHRYRAGERVCALVAGGGYAELCVAPEGQVLPVPANLTDVEAAALPETFFTVWANVFDEARLQPGERLLVHGGASGIGTTAIQLGAAFGATVFATAGSDAKCDACVHLGAAQAFNYRMGPFAEPLLAATGGQGSKPGVDVILDMVGGSYLQQNLRVLRPRGRLVLIALIGGAKAEIDLLPILTRRLVVTGSLLRPRSVAEKTAIGARLEARVWPLLHQGRIKPLIDSTFPLAEASRAHSRLEQGSHIGKVVLTRDPPTP